MTDFNWAMGTYLLAAALVCAAVLIVVVAIAATRINSRREKSWLDRIEAIDAMVTLALTATNPLVNPTPDVVAARRQLAELLQSPDLQDRPAVAYASRLCNEKGVNSQTVSTLSENDHRVALLTASMSAIWPTIQQTPPLEAMTADLAGWYMQWMDAAGRIISLLRGENDAVQVRVLLKSGFSNVSKLEARWVEYRDRLITVRLDLGMIARTTADLLANVDSIVKLVVGLARPTGTPKARLSDMQMEDYYRLLCKLPPERLTERHLLEHSSFVRYLALWLLREHFSAVSGTRFLGEPAGTEPDPRLLITAWWLNRPEPADALWSEGNQTVLDVTLRTMLANQRRAWLNRISLEGEA